jgi:Leucine rich repeat
MFKNKCIISASREILAIVCALFLTDLNLGNTKITDAGLKTLEGLKNLEHLLIHDTKVTDAGLKELTGLTNLQYLYLGGTGVTEASVAALGKALPICRITR